MEITNIKLIQIRNQSKLIAVADVTIDNMLVIHGIKILSSSEKGMMIAMPNTKLPNGKYSDIVHPISESARSVFENLLFPATEKMICEGRDTVQYSMRQPNSQRANTTQTLEDFSQVRSEKVQLVSESIKDEIFKWLEEK